MGGYWAYKTLGWGGYWGWDPVENTSLVPWLFTGALVHGMFLQRSRKRHRKVNLLLACTAYAAILYGTFLTRSGVLADFSVHSFIDLGITGWLVGDPRDVHRPVDRAAGLALALDPADGGRGVAAPVPQRPLHPRHRGLLRARLRDPARHLRPDPDAPDLDAVAGADELLRQDHDAGGLAARAARRASCRSSAWKGETGMGLFRNARRSLAVAAVLTGAAFALGADQPASLVLLFTAFFAADMNLRAVIRKAGNGKLGGAGGYLAHVGVGIMLAGIVDLRDLREVPAHHAADQRAEEGGRHDADVPAHRARRGRPQAGDGGPGRDGEGQGPSTRTRRCTRTAGRAS